MSPLPSSSRSLKSVQESLALKSSDWNMARTSSSSKKVLGFFHSAVKSCQFTHIETRERLWSPGGQLRLFPKKFSSLRSTYPSLLNHISLLACNWLGWTPPPVAHDNWGRGLDLHWDTCISFVPIETCSVSSIQQTTTLRTTRSRSPDNSGKTKSDWKGQLNPVKSIECQPFVPKPTRLSLPHGCEVDEWQIASIPFAGVEKVSAQVLLPVVWCI